MIKFLCGDVWKKKVDLSLKYQFWNQVGIKQEEKITNKGKETVQPRVFILGQPLVHCATLPITHLTNEITIFKAYKSMFPSWTFDHASLRLISSYRAGLQAKLKLVNEDILIVICSGVGDAPWTSWAPLQRRHYVTEWIQSQVSADGRRTW